MNIPKRFIVICEGKSDRAYLLALQSLLDGVLRPPDGWDEAPVRFIPRPEPSGVKTGYYDEVVPVYKKEREKYPNDKTLVWVDSDVYIWNVQRRGIGNGDAYRKRDKEDVPVFYFSYHKFEDFLVLHCEPRVFERWKNVMRENGHLQRRPLSWSDYAPVFQKVLPHYSKSMLPVGIVGEDGLLNLQKNLMDIEVKSAEALYPDGVPFAKFLVGILKEYYPSLFEQEAGCK